jgi:hypothetical protein
MLADLFEPILGKLNHVPDRGSVVSPVLGLPSRVGKIEIGDTWTNLPRLSVGLGVNLPHLGFPDILTLIVK